MLNSLALKGPRHEAYYHGLFFSLFLVGAEKSHELLKLSSGEAWLFAYYAKKEEEEEANNFFLASQKKFLLFFFLLFFRHFHSVNLKKRSEGIEAFCVWLFRTKMVVPFHS